MVETGYDLCQSSMFTTTFPAMKVIKTQSDPTHAISPWGALGERSSVTAPNDGL